MTRQATFDFGNKITSFSHQVLSHIFQGCHLFITTIVTCSHHSLSGSSVLSGLSFGHTMHHQSVIRGKHYGLHMIFATSTLGVVCHACHHQIILVVILATLNTLDIGYKNTAFKIPQQFLRL